MSVSNDDIIKDWSKGADYVIEKFDDDGDFSRKHLLNPSILPLLGNVKGKTILDAGCGEGYLCRLLVGMGAKLTGLEPADRLIQYAIKREQKEKLGINYVKEDLSKWQGNSDSFDIVVSNMVFMDIPDYRPAIKNCINVLKPKGSFVFSINHPSFEEQNNISQEFQHAKDWQEKPSLEISEYFKEYEIKNFTGYSFHRTLSTYVNFLIENGCEIKQIIEPQLSEDVGKQNPHHERNVHIPSFLVIHATKK